MWPGENVRRDGSSGPVYPQGMCCACLIVITGGFVFPFPPGASRVSIAAASGPAGAEAEDGEDSPTLQGWGARWIPATGVIPGDSEKQEPSL